MGAPSAHDHEIRRRRSTLSSSLGWWLIVTACSPLSRPGTAAPVPADAGSLDSGCARCGWLGAARKQARASAQKGIRNGTSSCVTQHRAHRKSSTFDPAHQATRQVACGSIDARGEQRRAQYCGRGTLRRWQSPGTVLYGRRQRERNACRGEGRRRLAVSPGARRCRRVAVLLGRILAILWRLTHR